jgi:hypothetical protein
LDDLLGSLRVAPSLLLKKRRSGELLNIFNPVKGPEDKAVIVGQKPFNV